MDMRRVMVVDDNVDAAETMATILQMLGHTTVEAHCATDALAVALDFQPDIAFLDIGMPGMSGFDLARKLHLLPGFTSLALVAVTGWSDAATVREAEAAGFCRHLTKPALIEEIDAAIRLFASRKAFSN